MPKPKIPYVTGEWRVICDRCGFRYHDVHLRREWTGLMTCHGPMTNDCWEPRNAQDFVRGVRDKQSPEWSRPLPDPIFTSATITGATQANPVVISAANNFTNGRTVYIENVNGMVEINNRRFTVANRTTATFERSGEDGSGHTAFSADVTADLPSTSGDQFGRASEDIVRSDL